MKLNYCLALSFIISAANAASGGSTNATFIAEQVAKIPACGISCLTITAPKVGCSVFNTTCQCEQPQLRDITADCMLANCTLYESLDLAKVSAAICELPYESQNRKLVIMTIVCCIIADGALIGRLLARFLLKQDFGLDDLTITIACVSGAIWTYFGVLFERNGMGEHIWMVNPNQIPNLLYWFYICEIIYSINIGLTKLAFLFFYLRVFSRPSFRRACYITMGFVVAYCAGFTCAGILQCDPIAYVWDKSLDGHCINYNALSWGNAGINIFQDVFIILLPIQELRQLKLDFKQRIQMYLMFGVGLLITLISCIRLNSLHHFGLTADPTWDNVDTTFWSTVECTASVFCACLPAMRAGLARLFNKMLGRPRTVLGSSRGTSGRHGSKPSNASNATDLEALTKSDSPSWEKQTQHINAQEIQQAPRKSKVTEHEKMLWEEEMRVLKYHDPAQITVKITANNLDRDEQESSTGGGVRDSKSSIKKSSFPIKRLSETNWPLVGLGRSTSQSQRQSKSPWDAQFSDDVGDKGLPGKRGTFL